MPPGPPFPRTAFPGLSLDRPKFRFFFPLPPQNSFFSSFSGCLLVDFWWCFEDQDPQMCTFGVHGLSWSHTTAPRAQTCTFEGLRRFKHHQNSTRKTPRENTETAKRWREREEKERNFGRSGGGRVQWRWEGGPAEGGPGKSKPATTTTTKNNNAKPRTTGAPKGPARSPKQGLGFVSSGVGHNNTRKHTTQQHNNTTKQQQQRNNNNNNNNN